MPLLPVQNNFPTGKKIQILTTSLRQGYDKVRLITLVFTDKKRQNDGDGSKPRNTPFTFKNAKLGLGVPEGNTVSDFESDSLTE